MKEQLESKLKELVKEKQIEILFACESGSRAWGFASPDSDYDIRFIYKHKLDWYLSIEEHKDSLEIPIVDNLDFGGWELRKTLKLIYKSNPTIFEWLQSPIIYIENVKFKNEMLRLCRQYFHPGRTAAHYLGIAKKSLYEIEDNHIKIKKYFYILRPLLAAMWTLRHNEIPPMEFAILLSLIKDKDEILELVNDLLKKKKYAIEGEKIHLIPGLQGFIEEQIKGCTDFIQEQVNRHNEPNDLNTFFRNQFDF